MFFDCVHSFVPHEFGRYLPVAGGQSSTCEPVLFYRCCRIVHFQICRYDNSNYQLLNTCTCQVLDQKLFKGDQILSLQPSEAGTINCLI